jgi:hypothetical protein
MDGSNSGARRMVVGYGEEYEKKISKELREESSTNSITRHPCSAK